MYRDQSETEVDRLIHLAESNLEIIREKDKRLRRAEARGCGAAGAGFILMVLLTATAWYAHSLEERIGRMGVGMVDSTAALVECEDELRESQEAARAYAEMAAGASQALHIVTQDSSAAGELFQYTAQPRSFRDAADRAISSVAGR